MTVQKCCLTLVWDTIGWDNISPEVQNLGIDLSPVGEIFVFSSERNSTKLDWKQDLNVLYQVCVFRADRKNKMAALASDWLSYFCHLLWNHRTDFNETWQEARSLRPLPSLCFLGRSEKQNDCPGLWLAETFSIYPLKRIQRNLTGRTIKTSTTKFVFFGPIGKQDGCPVRSVNKGGTLYSGARYVALWASCYTQVMLIEWDIGFEFLYIARLWHIGHGFLKFFSYIIFNSERKNIRKSAISL